MFGGLPLEGSEQPVQGSGTVIGAEVAVQSSLEEEDLRSARYHAIRKGQKQIESPIGIANQLQNMSIVMDEQIAAIRAEVKAGLEQGFLGDKLDQAAVPFRSAQASVYQRN